MGVITGTKAVCTELGGEYKILIVTATPAADSDTIVLTEADHGVSDIIYARAHLTAGLDAHLTHLQTSWSASTITIKQIKANGTTAADNWGSAALEIIVVAKKTANT